MEKGIYYIVVQITSFNLVKIPNEFDPSYKRMKLCLFAVIAHHTEIKLGARTECRLTVKPPYQAVSEAKQLTGNCSCDLLVFKAPTSQICLLVQSLITHLHALYPHTAGRQNAVKIALKRPRLLGNTVCLMEPSPLTGQGHIPQLFHGYLGTPPTQAPQSHLKFLRCLLKLESQLIM